MFELEVMLREGQGEAEGVAIARDLMARLGIAEEQLESLAYIEGRPNSPTASIATHAPPWVSQARARPALGTSGAAFRFAISRFLRVCATTSA